MGEPKNEDGISQAEADAMIAAQSGQGSDDPDANAIELLTRENAALKRKLSHGEGVESLVRHCVAEHYKRPLEIILPPKLKDIGRGTEQVAVAHLSDTQMGKRTATYDSVIGAQRCHLFAQKVAEITEIKRAGSTIKNLRLYLGGDMVEGEYGNYPSQPYDVDSPVITQAVRTCPDIFEGMIYFLLRHFDQIHVACVPGNHGRGASAKQTRHNETNWDRVCYLVLRDRILGSEERAVQPCNCGSKKWWKNCCGKEIRRRVTFDIADEFWCLDRVWDWGNLIVHGDQIQGWAGIPYYGVQKKTHGWADAMPKDWDNLLFGHFHTFASGTINYRRWFANGTTESSNTFALEALAAAGPPSQRLLFMTEKHGIVSDHQIFLEDDRAPIMQRKFKQAALEYGPENVKIMLDMLMATQSTQAQQGE
jgi:hypothetical protein